MKPRHLIVLSLFLCNVFVADSQPADKIISKYIQYTGGAKNWKAVTTIITTGTYNYGGVKFPYTAFSKAPDLYKYIVTFNGKSFIQGYNGKAGWRIDGFKDETAVTMLTGKQGTAMANEADVELESPFINYRKKGYTVVLEGMDTVNNHPCYKIRLQKLTDTATYFFDAKDYSLVKQQTISKNSEMNNAPMDIFFSDYQVTGKIKMPHTITCTSGGQTILIITVESVKLNDAIPDSVFQP